MNHHRAPGYKPHIEMLCSYQNYLLTNEKALTYSEDKKKLSKWYNDTDLVTEQEA